jgi:hypothetical protein
LRCEIIIVGQLFWGTPALAGDVECRCRQWPRPYCCVVDVNIRLR